MPTRLAVYAAFWVARSAFNSLFEMRHNRQFCGRSRYGTFNSLFEMPARLSCSTTSAPIWLSILYLRCKVPSWAFTVQFETPSFNSLFEMLTPRCFSHLSKFTPLSILYLRCGGYVCGVCADLVRNLSILYLRCALFELPALLGIPQYAFNSLFEMQRGCRSPSAVATS